jgi:hypothetical protein
MSGMTICEPCAMRDAGNTVAAETLEAIRAQRTILAVLDGVGDAVGEVARELHGCYDCAEHLAALYLDMYAATLARAAGSAEAAARWMERGLIELEDLDGK